MHYRKFKCKVSVLSLRLGRSIPSVVADFESASMYKKLSLVLKKVNEIKITKEYL